MRHSCHGIVQVERNEEVNVPAFFRIIDARAKEEDLGLRIVKMNGAHNGFPLPV